MRKTKQATFSELEHDAKKRKTRRERFLERMEGLVPWGGLGGSDPPALSEGGSGSASVSAVVDAAGALRIDDAALTR